MTLRRPLPSNQGPRRRASETSPRGCEAVTAAKLGAQQTPNSGATDPLRKADMAKRLHALRRTLRADQKTTEKLGVRIDHKMLSKLRSDCLVGEMPALVLTFTHPRFRDTLTPQHWALLPLDEMQALLALVESEEADNG